MIAGNGAISGVGLARGGPRCAGATTLAEYRWHVGKDAALERLPARSDRRSGPAPGDGRFQGYTLAGELVLVIPMTRSSNSKPAVRGLWLRTYQRQVSLKPRMPS